MSFALSQTISQHQEQTPTSRKKQFMAAALNAFKLCRMGDKQVYTCNVARLRACDRLGEDSEIPLWKTHFFLRSRRFDMVAAVIFNEHPGADLARLSAQAVDTIYVLESGEILNPSNGQRLPLGDGIDFASAEEE